jgi:hypothetical protein
MRYLNILPLRSKHIHRPSCASSTSCLKKKTLDPRSKIAYLPDRHNHAPHGAATRLHVPSLLNARVIHAPRLTSPSSVCHTGSQPATLLVRATLKNSFEFLLSFFWYIDPHQIISFSQAHKLRVLLHAPDPNPLKKNEKVRDDHIMCESGSVRQLDNSPSGTHFIFFYFGPQLALFGSWPAVGPFSVLGPNQPCSRQIQINEFVNRLIGLAHTLHVCQIRVSQLDNCPSGLIFFLGLQSALSWFLAHIAQLGSSIFSSWPVVSLSKHSLLSKSSSIEGLY